MGVQVATGPRLYPDSASPSHAFAAVISSLSSKRKGSRPIVDRCSPFLAPGYRRLSRSRSSEPSIASGRLGRETPPPRRTITASSESFLPADGDDEVFLRRLRELALRLHLPVLEENSKSSQQEPDSLFSPSSASIPIPPPPPFEKPELPWPEAPGWPEGDAAVVPASVERNANRVELPLSLRLIKRRKRQLLRWEGGLLAAGESARCSVKKAFSSMVFIIRELHCYSLQMRHALVPDDIQGVLSRVQGEMHASFVWLFQQVFSCTPALMVSVMLLLADFTVYSMGNSVAAAPSQPLPAAAQSIIAVIETQNQSNRPLLLDPTTVKTFTVSGRTASVGGGEGGGKARPVAGAADDGRPDGSSSSGIEGGTIIPDGVSTTPATVSDEAAVAREEDDEGVIWERVVEEANRMQAGQRGGWLVDSDTANALVAPVTVELGQEDAMDYFRTDLEYQQAVAEDPENPLLLANFARFLHAVLCDLDRAEYYFKRAATVKPADAYALSQHATFLWAARGDLCAAEERFQEAIEAEPSNSHYEATYARFLWSTGGEETCFPLDG